MRRHFGRSYLIDMLIGFAIFAGVFAIRDGLSLSEWPLLAAALCDACFVPGIILLCLAALVFVSNDGKFDMLSYGVQKALQIVLSEKKRSKYPKTFYEYKQQKWAAPKTSFVFLLAAGGVLLAMAGVCLYFSGALA